MTYKIAQVTETDLESLIELRIAAMRESLEKVGRFDPVRARNRFIKSFSLADSRKILIDGNLAGLYVLKKESDHFYLDHLYIHPEYQNSGLGSELLQLIQQYTKEEGLPIRLGALKKSRANRFYKKHGFVCTHEAEWDVYYEYSHESK